MEARDEFICLGFILLMYGVNGNMVEKSTTRLWCGVALLVCLSVVVMTAVIMIIRVYLFLRGMLSMPSADGASLMLD